MLAAPWAASAGRSRARKRKRRAVFPEPRAGTEQIQAGAAAVFRRVMSVILGGLPVLLVHRVLSSAQGTGSGELRCLGCSTSQVRELNTIVKGPCFERLQVLGPVPPSRGVETSPHTPPCHTQGVPCIQGRSVACPDAFPRDTGQRGESTIGGGSLRPRNSGPQGPRRAAEFWRCMRYSYGNANPLCSPDALLQLL